MVEKVHDLISNLKTMIILPWNFDILSRRWALKLIFYSLFFLLCLLLLQVFLLTVFCLKHVSRLGTSRQSLQGVHG